MPKYSRLVILTSIAAFLMLVWAGITPQQLQAQQNSIEVAYTYDISDNDAVDGDVLVYDQTKGIIRAQEVLSNRLFGILKNSSLLVYRRVDQTGKAVARNGITDVNVSTLNGEIKPGDFITSSEIPGKGQKTVVSGYVIGTALKGLKEGEGQKVQVGDKSATLGKIPVSLRIEYAEISSARSNLRLLEFFNAAVMRSVKDPEKFTQVMRYIIAGVVLIVGFSFSFFTFARSIPKGIEAIGRNPLAEKAIRFSIGMNIGLMIVTALIGIGAALLILTI